MRRTSPNCAFIAREQARILTSLTRENAPAIVAALEEFATDDRRTRFREVFAGRLDAVTVLMDAPHDPHNGAAVIRTCDAFGIQSLHVIERLEGFLAARSVARGSERWVDVQSHLTAAQAIETLRASGHTLVATHPEGELSPRDLASIPRLALVLGNERDGILHELFEACDRSVRIPMRGFAESLNVSVTAAVLLEHATFGRPGDLDPAEQTRLYARALALSVAHAAEILELRGIAIAPSEFPASAF